MLEAKSGKTPNFILIHVVLFPEFLHPQGGRCGGWGCGGELPPTTHSTPCPKGISCGRTPLSSPTSPCGSAHMGFPCSFRHHSAYFTAATTTCPYIFIGLFALHTLHLPRDCEFHENNTNACFVSQHISRALAWYTGCTGLLVNACE